MLDTLAFEVDLVWAVARAGSEPAALGYEPFPNSHADAPHRNRRKSALLT